MRKLFLVTFRWHCHSLKAFGSSILLVTLVGTLMLAPLGCSRKRTTDSQGSTTRLSTSPTVDVSPSPSPSPEAITPTITFSLSVESVPEEAYSDETFPSSSVFAMSQAVVQARQVASRSQENQLVRLASLNDEVCRIAIAENLVTLTAFTNSSCTKAAPGTLRVKNNPVAVDADGKAIFEELSYAWHVAGLEGKLYLKATALSGESICTSNGVRILRRLSVAAPISSGAITLSNGDAGAGVAGALAASRNDPWNSLTIDALGRIVTVGSSLNASGYSRMVIARYLPDGTLDPSFNSTGAVVFDPPRPWTAPSPAAIENENGYAVEVDAVNFPEDPRYLVLGRSYTSLNGDRAIVWRFKGDGTLDASFGSGTGYALIRGDSSTGFAGSSGSLRSDLARAIAITPDGKYLVAGYGTEPAAVYGITPNDVTLARLNSDGSLDTSFGSQAGRAGWVVFGGGVARQPGLAGASPGRDTLPFSSMILDPDGNAFLAGYGINVYGGYDPFVIKVKSDGNLDSNFGTDGVFLGLHNLAGPSGVIKEGKYDIGMSLLRESSGKLLLAGYSKNPDGAYDPVLWRLTANGQRDTSFQGKGYAVFHSKVAGVSGRPAYLKTELFRKVLGPDSNGRYLLIGTTRNGIGTISGGTDVVMWRYLSDGSLDTSFRGKGYQVLREGMAASGGGLVNSESVNSAAYSEVTARIWIAGSSLNANGRTVPSLWRVSSDGYTDSTVEQSPPRLSLRLVNEEASLSLVQGGCEPLELRAAGDTNSPLLLASQLTVNLSVSDSDSSTLYSDSSCNTLLSPAKTITLLLSENFVKRLYVKFGSNPSLSVTAQGPTGIQSSTATIGSIGPALVGSPAAPIYTKSGVSTFNGVSDKVDSALTQMNPVNAPSMSWSFWINPSRGTIDFVKHLFGGAVLTKDGNGNITAMTQGGRFISLQWVGDSPRFLVNTRYPFVSTWQAAGAELETWQHIAVVFTPTRLIFYKNGARSIYTGTPSFATNSETHFLAGLNLITGYSYLTTTAFTGSMAEIKIYDRALSDAEVGTLFSQDRLTYAVAADPQAKSPVLSFSIPSDPNAYLNLTNTCRPVLLQATTANALGFPEIKPLALATTISLQSTLAGSFYLDATCTQAISSRSYAAGDQVTETLYFIASQAGTAALTATANGFTSNATSFQFANAAAGPVVDLDIEKANAGTAAYSPGCTGLSSSGATGNRWYNQATQTNTGVVADSRWTNYCYQGSGISNDPYRFDFPGWYLAGGGYAAEGCATMTCYAGKPFINPDYTPNLIQNDTLSYEFWIKPTSDLNRRVILTNYGGFTFYAAPVASDTTKIRFELWALLQANNTGFGFEASQASFGQWTHVVLIHSQRHATLIVNGTRKEVKYIGTGLTMKGAMIIGIHQDGAVSQFFLGSLALFRAYERALTDAEVLEHYNATKGRFGF